MAKEDALTYARLREVLNYNPQTGMFTRAVTLAQNAQTGDVAGSEWASKKYPQARYWVITLDGHKYAAHRLAFFYMTQRWPRATIDHIDHNGLNNCWANLREATLGQNMQNTRIRSDNTSGFKGVAWSEDRLKWQAYITVDRKRIPLGRFDRMEDAVNAYQKAARKYFGDFAYLGGEMAQPDDVGAE